MRNILNWNWNKITITDFVVGLWCLLPVALIYSKFLLSQCMFLIAVAALISFIKKEKKLTRPNLIFWFFLTVPFFLYLINGVYSSDMSYWAERVRIKLPYLLLPLSFLVLPAPTQKQWHILLWSLIITILASSVLVLIHYFQNQTLILEEIHQGKPFPTPMSHIRYSLMVVIAILAGVNILEETKQKSSKIIAIICTTLMIVFLHFIAVRSGLLAFYAMLLLGICFFIYTEKKWILGLGIMLGSVLFLYLAIHNIPSLASKMGYMNWDWMVIKGEIKGDNGVYSDNVRLFSLKLGAEIIKENPVLGIGIGDLKNEMENKIHAQYPEMEVILPHSQWITVLAGCGILGFILFFSGIFYPLFFQKYRTDFFIVGIFAILFTSFLSENTIENAIGTALFTCYPFLAFWRKG